MRLFGWGRRGGEGTYEGFLAELFGFGEVLFPLEEGEGFVD